MIYHRKCKINMLLTPHQVVQLMEQLSLRIDSSALNWLIPIKREMVQPLGLVGLPPKRTAV